jgi:hypothetical protein
MIFLFVFSVVLHSLVSFIEVDPMRMCRSTTFERPAITVGKGAELERVDVTVSIHVLEVINFDGSKNVGYFDKSIIPLQS